MGFKSNAEIARIYRGLIDQTLPKPDWTHAAHFAAACAMIADPARNAERVNTVMTSECGQSDWLLAYWSKEALFSPIARHEWVVPDLKTLPFPVRLS